MENKRYGALKFMKFWEGVGKSDRELLLLQTPSLFSPFKYTGSIVVHYWRYFLSQLVLRPAAALVNLVFLLGHKFFHWRRTSLYGLFYCKRWRTNWVIVWISLLHMIDSTILWSFCPHAFVFSHDVYPFRSSIMSCFLRSLLSLSSLSISLS